MTVRTRVAPSPTGDPHVGTAYVALMNRLFAKQRGGSFVLRIEDTDRARSTPESEAAILRSLRWLGVEWDEGPDVGGPRGPYRQSERGHVYAVHAARLLADGHAFRCFCGDGRLDAMRAAQRAAGAQPGYDGACLSLSRAESDARAAAGEPFVLRMKVPEGGACTFTDMKRGAVTIPWANVDMQVLVKSDGFPTYHLANVVDDHLMGITHVLRGEEWLSSAPKHALLYGYLGWEMPALCHLPLLRNPDRSKLSKRKNPTSVLWFERMGYLPEALLNLLGLFAMNIGDGSDVLSPGDLLSGFSVDHVALGGPVFDLAKLDHLNASHIRAMPPEAFAARYAAWRAGIDMAEVAAVARERIVRLSDLAPLSAFLWSGRVAPAAADMATAKLPAPAAAEAVADVAGRLEALPAWERGAIEAAVRAAAEARGVKMRDFVRPLYVAVTGRAQSLPLFESMELLGRDMVRMRLRDAVAALGAA
jgi:glutamyl-tRNA synthetase